jgi:hypothetical protein
MQLDSCQIAAEWSSLAISPWTLSNIGYKERIILKRNSLIMMFNLTTVAGLSPLESVLAEF